MLLLSALIALSTGSTFKIPGEGSLQLPPGCTAPDVMVGIDSIDGFISCPTTKSEIHFVASPMAPDFCRSLATVSLKAASGAPIRICLQSPAGANNRLERMFVDLGVGVLTTEIKDSRDVLLMLQISFSLRLDRKQ